MLFTLEKSAVLIIMKPRHLEAFLHIQHEEQKLNLRP